MNLLSHLIINLLLLCPLVQDPDANYITLNRDVCYGNCPSYTITIYSTGVTEYVGHEFVRVVGRQLFTIPKDSAAYLFHRAEEIGFYLLKPEYIVGLKFRKNKTGSIDTLTVTVTDLPTYTVTVKISNRTKSVIDYFRGHNELHEYEAPDELRLFEKEIDRIAHTMDFIQ